MEQVKAEVVTVRVWDGPYGDHRPRRIEYVEEAPLNCGPGDRLVQAKAWLVDRAVHLIDLIDWCHPCVDDIESITFRITVDTVIREYPLAEMREKILSIF